MPSNSSGSDVMSYVRAPQTWPYWQSEIISTSGVEVVDEGDVVDGQARLLGFDVTGRSTTLKVAREAVEQDVIVGVRMRVTYSVTPTSGGSIIRHRMEADLPTGIAGSVLSLLLGWRLKRMQNSLLTALSRATGSAQTEVGRS